MATSGQVPEAYMCLRGCLENALTGIHIHQDKHLAEVFLRRHDDKKSLRNARGQFRPALMLEKLGEVDNKTAQIAKKLYDWTIDYGAHPNARAYLTNMELNEQDGNRAVISDYLASDGAALEVCFKCAATVGICALDIFKLILPERFEILGVSLQLDKLRQGL